MLVAAERRPAGLDGLHGTAHAEHALFDGHAGLLTPPPRRRDFGLPRSELVHTGHAARFVHRRNVRSAASRVLAPYVGPSLSWI